MSAKNCRAIAASILTALRNGNGSLTSQLGKYQDLPDYSLLQEICFGSCRWFFQLEQLLQPLLIKPLKTKDRNLESLLIVGLYQLKHLSTPEYAVINETVSAAQVLGKSWGKSLVNAVLRNYLRNKAELERHLEESSLAATSSHPQWMVDALFDQWPHQATQILSNNNTRPPMTLRINQQLTTRDKVLDRLSNAGIAAHAGTLCATSIYLADPCPVKDLPGFSDGLISVQDEASQLVAPLLQLSPGLTVLDACAAPGGKTCHILESERSLTSVASIDAEPSRLLRLTENLQRLGLQATIHCADAKATEKWWNGVGFDRILLDAPCSASGVIRRHPDIKLLRSPANVEVLQAEQRQFLLALWPTLKSNGLLLYTTCSIFREENELIIETFLQSVPDAKYESIVADWGVECRYGRQLLTGANDGPDGFFFCLLRKS